MNTSENRQKKGFTIVELIVVIAVIGILAGISIVGFKRYQADTRDARRSSSITSIAEALEKYYDINGEYPSCSALSATGTSVSQTTLKGINQSTLIAPQANSADSNSIKCTSSGNVLNSGGVDFFEYQGDNSSNCNGSVSCPQFVLKYKDEASGTIKTITSRRSALVTTLAGSGVAGFADGTGTAAQFNRPQGVAVDSSGTVYESDFYNSRVRKITPAGVVTTFAGSGVQGYADGAGTAAQFITTFGVAVDSSGTVYVADFSNHRIRKITPAGVVTTLAGSGVAGYADGTGTAAQFNGPEGVAVDSSGTVYVGDSINHCIRKISPAGVVTTLAGSGVAGYADGTGTAAQFNRPDGVAVDSVGTVYVGDPMNHRIRKITPTGIVTTFAGSSVAGYADGTGTAAQFITPDGVAVDSSGTVYVADFSDHRIRKITPAGVVTTLAGSGIAGYADSTGTTAQFNGPPSLAVDSAGTVYVADSINHRIRKIQ